MQLFHYQIAGVLSSCLVISKLVHDLFPLEIFCDVFQLKKHVSFVGKSRLLIFKASTTGVALRGTPRGSAGGALRERSGRHH